jgi:hypothetical protein
MSIAYLQLTQEDIGQFGQLHAAEKAARDKSRTDRVRLLRFLKKGVPPASAKPQSSWAFVCDPSSAGRGMTKRITLVARHSDYDELALWVLWMKPARSRAGTIWWRVGA